MGKLGEFLEFKELVKKLTERTLREEYLEHKEYRSKDFHCDHKLSIKESFEQGVPPDMVAHICNLQITDATYNLKKGSKSSITFEELLEEITLREEYL